VFTAIHHSNNHHLNTLFFFALGEGVRWPLYRLPALAAGVATIALAAALGARRGRLEGVLAALLASASFSLVHFASEARGYALAVACALGATLALLRFLERRRGAAAWTFAACAIAGILSQLVWVLYWAGALALSVARLARGPEPPRTRALAFARLHAPPAAALAALWWVDLRWMTVGGGSATPAARELARAVGFSLGLPVRPSLAPVDAALALAILALGLRLLRRDRDPLGWLFLVAIALAPAAAFALLRPELIAVRYFLIGIALFLVLYAWVLADALRVGGARRAAAALALAAFVAGNGLHVARFLAHGRGGYAAALRFMAENDPAAVIRVGSDHDFRNAMVLRFHARDLPPGRRLAYVDRRERESAPPEWMVVHRELRPDAPARELVFGRAGRYRLVAEFDHAALSGFWWGLYRRGATPPPQDHEPEAGVAKGLRADALDRLVVRVEPGAQARPVARIAAKGSDAELRALAMRQHHPLGRSRLEAREHRVLAERRELGREEEQVWDWVPQS
jgi:hypothetical protein